MAKRTVLIIDDYKPWLNLAAKSFAQYNYIVHTALSGGDGLKLAELHHPDCILLDFHLPDEDAAMVCARIRANEAVKNTPIIIVSNDATQDLTAYQKCRSVSFVTKLGPLSKIFSAVENVIGQVERVRGIVEKGDLRLEPINCQVFRDSRPLIRLTPEQFGFLSLLMNNSPEFVSEDEIAKDVFRSDFAPDKIDAIRALACRLRKKMGPQLGRRIKNKADRGWIYVQPHPRKKFPPETDTNT